MVFPRRSLKPQQPLRVNLGHSMAQGIEAFFYYPTKRGLWDAVSGKFATPVSTAPTVVATSEGLAQFLTTSIELRLTARNPLAAGAGDCTVIARYRPRSILGDRSWVIKYATSSAISGRGCAIGSDTANAHGWGLATNATTALGAGTGTGTVGQFKTIGVQADPAADGQVFGWVDGVPQGASSVSGNVLGFGALDEIVLGGNTQGYDVYPDDDLLWAVVFNRRLTDAEHAWWHRNGFDVLERGGQPALFVPAAGGGTVTGTGELSSGAAAAGGTGTSGSTGSGTPDAQASSVAGSGVSLSTGTGALDSGAATVDGTGAVEWTGTGALAAGDATVDGAGASASTGTGDASSDAAAVDGAGVSESAGTGSLDAGTATVEGSGELVVTGTGDLASGVATIDGTGESLSTGTGDLQAGAATIFGSVEEVSTGTGDLVAGDSDTTGAGVSGSTGTAALVVAVATIAASGVSGSTGSGALAANDNEIDGAGISLSTGTGILLAVGSDIVGSSDPAGSAQRRGNYNAAVARGSYTAANPRA